MAEAVANPLIAALRANTTQSGAMPTGVQNVSFPWQKNSTGGALVLPTRKTPTTPTPPPPVTPPPSQPPATPPPRPPNTPPFNPNFNPRLSPDGRLPSADMRIEADAPGRDDVGAVTGVAAATSPVTDDMSVRQTLERVMADQNPQAVMPPPAAPMPANVDIPAFDSGTNFEMPETLFATPAPFVPGFTPDADVAAAMQAPPVVQQPPAAPELDPSLLAMLGGQGGQPVPATQPLPEEPMYDMQLPNWYFDAFGMGSTR
jgi:hypothetical protein